MRLDYSLLNFSRAPLFNHVDVFCSWCRPQSKRNVQPASSFLLETREIGIAISLQNLSNKKKSLSVVLRVYFAKWKCRQACRFYVWDSLFTKCKCHCQQVIKNWLSRTFYFFLYVANVNSYFFGMMMMLVSSELFLRLPQISAFLPLFVFPGCYAF